MAAAVEVCQSTGGVETVTHGITQVVFGTVDTPGLTPGGAAGGFQQAGTNSMQIALRLHLTDLGGALRLENLRVYAASTVSGIVLATNLSTSAVTYATTKITVYQAPASTTTAVPNTLASSDPGTANLGIGGSLTGTLTATGFSDYAYLQAQVDDAVIQSMTSSLFVAYDEVG